MSVFTRLGQRIRASGLPDWVGEPETIWVVFVLGFALGAIIL